MENLVKKMNAKAMSYWNMSVKEFIEQGVKNGRHWYYLRDVLGLTERKFVVLLNHLGLDVDSIRQTKEDFKKLFEEPQSITELEEGEISVYA